jgi:TRAP-type mannitol/chloroaromatic compound transport system substrate-binding protein
VLSQLEDYQRELDEKTTEDQVDSRIQSRYDELVTHLQIALRSVKDDEANFKACIDRIEATSTDLKAVKAERSELKELSSSVLESILSSSAPG